MSKIRLIIDKMNFEKFIHSQPGGHRRMQF